MTTDRILSVEEVRSALARTMGSRWTATQWAAGGEVLDSHEALRDALTAAEERAAILTRDLAWWQEDRDAALREVTRLREALSELVDACETPGDGWRELVARVCRAVPTAAEERHQGEVESHNRTMQELRNAEAERDEWKRTWATAKDDATAEYDRISAERDADQAAILDGYERARKAEDRAIAAEAEVTRLREALAEMEQARNAAVRDGEMMMLDQREMRESAEATCEALNESLNAEIDRTERAEAEVTHLREVLGEVERQVGLMDSRVPESAALYAYVLAALAPVPQEDQ